MGPPEDYDLVSAMVFNLLTSMGLRQHHKVLDIGCGSLRVARLLIPYLNPGNYVGVEPNRWLVEDGISNEIGRDQIALKRPTLIYGDSLRQCADPLQLDFAFAQSIFSHCGKDLVRHWLTQAAPHLKEDGVLLATFLPATQDYEGTGWVYPGCVNFRPETMAQLAADCGFGFQLLDWAHPRQSWALFSKPGFDASLVGGGQVSWNKAVAKVVAGR